LKLASRASSIQKKLSISDKERLKFQSVFEYSVTGILILDKKGLIQYGNRKSRELMVESDDANLLKIPFADFFENEFKIKVEKSILNVFKVNKTYKTFKAQIFNQKKIHWLDLSLAPLFFEQENDAILVSLIDVTQEVINIEKEKEQKKELQTLLNSVTESILFIEKNGKIKALNITAANRLNSNPEDLIGVNYFDTVPTSLRKRRSEMFDNIIMYKKPLIEMEMVGNYNNLVSMYPNINADGDVDYISEFVQDITERRVAEEQIDNLKQRVLRYQMNPHFIFNSLTSIQSFVIRNDSDMASKYLNSFARLIRLILESSRHDYISLKSEIDILNYYLEIQKMRFSDNLNFSFEIDPKLDTDRIKIPPMLAQPFIENSIEHGIQHLDEIGELKIKFVSDDTRLIIQLHDNGIGRVASHNLNKENIITSSSLSTEIINERIDAINKYSKKGISYNIIDLKNDLNQAIGTQVIISIPIDYF
ncbi:MAG: histidine kinase, partial [Bacteroidales bacterium]|nr:histidine kinase [Bacteroidales bacterium]